MSLADDILARHGLSGPAARLPFQGNATEAFATATHVLKVALPRHREQVLTEALVAPLARAAGVRTPALVAWAHQEALAYSLWERAPGSPLDERDDPRAWRQVGRELARLHTVASAEDPCGLLRKPDKRDARPYLAALPPERAAFVARWLARCEPARPGAPRLLHYDVHGLNVILAPEGATLIDWADAAWGDPAAEFGSIPMRHVEATLAGYEEVGSLGPGAEGRILRAVLGQSVRKLVTSAWSEPLDELLAWLRAGPAPRFHAWLPEGGASGWR